MSSAIHKRWAFWRTIGARLTLWGAAITLLACVLLCMLLYFGLRHSLIREVDGFLEGEVYEFRSILTEEKEQTDLSGVEREIRRELGSRLRRDLTFRLLDGSGRLLLSSDAADPLPNPWTLAPIGKAESEAAETVTVRVPHRGPSYRVCSHWIKLHDGVSYVAQAAYVFDGAENSLAVFRQVCVAALLVVPIMALAGGYVLARRSLRPVERITQTAKEIGARDLSRRIALSGSGDELDRLAETLNGMLGRIEGHVQRMQQFTADASHELRSPLAALRGGAEVALSRPRSAEELRTVLEESMEHYSRLSRIAEDLLILARADVGQLPLARDWIRLDQAAADVVDLYTPLAQDRGIHLGLADGPAVKISADGARIRQLLGNLIDNAVKYGGTGCHINVTVTQMDASAIVVVADDGPGIAAEDLPHLFNRFYRAERSRSSRAAGGAGLGLPICRTIAELHGGDIRIESRPDQGTTVTVSLPLSGDSRP
ncbi:MAG TPA: heavy metal sensor histidine kinase [Phycisphaerae bacterium]|nr:heavy metal sensor histidine kinase [Phycisphaerae bacterium]